MGEVDIIYDSMNTQVWDMSEPSFGKQKTRKEIYGKSHRKFKSNVQARAYAIKLAKKKNQHAFFDKYYGENVLVGRKKKAFGGVF